MEINNIPHEILLLGYVRQITKHDNCSDNVSNNMISNIIHICYLYYIDQTIIDKIDSFIKNKIDALKNLMDTTETQSLLLLLKNKWNIMFIVDKYFNNPSKTLKDAGHIPTDITKSQHNQPKMSSNTCQSCVEFNDKILSLTCNHKIICKNCWIYYLKTALNSAECVSLTCPKDGCNIIVSKDMWKLLLSKQYQLYYQRYLTYLRQHCIRYNKEFSKCSNIHCNMVYFTSVMTEQCEYVECSQCGTDYSCMKCKHPPHFPISCERAQLWTNKILANKKQIDLMELDYRVCTQCQTKHSKSQGSNYIKCLCGLNFCWLCGVKIVKWGKNHWCDPSEYVNKYQTFSFAYNYIRYYSYLKSAEIAISNREAVLLHTGDLVYVTEGIDELIQCCKILAWTYPIAFYLNTNESETFMKYQRDCENVCQQLHLILDFQASRICETNVKTQFVGYTLSARNYKSQMLNCIQNQLKHLLNTDEGE